MTDAIRTDALLKRYGGWRTIRRAAREAPPAVAGLSITVPSGGITGLLGPNGAGKSTLTKLLLGLAQPTSGSATVLGHDTQRDSLAIRRDVGYVPEERSVLGWMRVSNFIAGVAALSERWDAAHADRLIQRWNVNERARIRELSSGTRSRLLLLVALARRANLLVLDEPTTGLDPAAVDDALSELAMSAADGATILLVTHRLEEVERICDRVIVMNSGHMVAQSNLDDLRARWREIEVANHPSLGEMRNWPEAALVTPFGDHARLLVHADPDAVVARLSMMGADVCDVRSLSLREIYLSLTRTQDDSHDRRDASA